MRSNDGSSQILLAGALVSAAVHAGLMLGFVRWPGAFGQRAPEGAVPERAPEARHKQQEPPTVRLGIEKSSAATLTWIGFESATEHHATLSTTEQSAFTTEVAPAQRAQPEETEPQPEPAPEAPPAPPAPQQIAEQVRALSERLAAAQRQVEERLTDLAETLPVIRPQPQEPSAPAPSPAQAGAPTPAPANPGAPQPSGLPGTPSDKESIATSIKKAPTVRPGQVVAGQGLEIQTRAPRWTYSTMLTRRPRNPTIRITFGRDGTVKRAEFVHDGTKAHNTGYDDVDQPLLNAVYSWTAKGRALNELKPGDPGISIIITVILSG